MQCLSKKLTTIRNNYVPYQTIKIYYNFIYLICKKMTCYLPINLMKKQPKNDKPYDFINREQSKLKLLFEATSVWNCFKQFFVASLLLRTPVHLKICLVLKFFKQLKKFFSVIPRSIRKETDPKSKYPASLIKKMMMMNKLKENPQNIPKSPWESKNP